MSETLRDDLQSALGTAYTIDRELGGGGMSRVFLAEEVRFRRKVVVKVLTPDLAAGVSAGRFEREIMVAAQLAHPSIVPVLTAGDANGLPYYTMPYVLGESLRARILKVGSFSIGETVSVLRDIARALAYAHERGIVHRDIKPENVLLASGAAVVTDFGIAKAIAAARADMGDATITRVGTSVGTPAYMSPEQATGDPTTDYRADIYSFGCLAYELLTGETPFHALPVHKLIAAHISDRPVDVAARRTDCPAGLAEVVMQCLEKNPDHRIGSAGEVLQRLEPLTTLSGERVGATITASRQVKRATATAMVLAGALVIAAGAWILAQRRTARDSNSGTPSATLRSIAVMPFTNVGGDTAEAYFADGIAEELATALSKVQGLRVVARQSSFRSGGQRVDEREAGRTLGVDALLAGTVRRAGSQMRLTARLIQVSDESLLWSEQYNREVSDLFTVQNEITQAILGAVRGRLASGTGPNEVPTGASGARRGPSNSDAHDLYLRGEFNLRRRNIAAAMDYFRRAVALDSTYAQAYSGLSAALEMMPYFGGLPAHSVRDSAIAAAQRALSLDSSLAETHTSMALAYQHANQWTEADREHRLAVTIDPGDAPAHQQYARFLFTVGLVDSATAEIRRAESLDPFSPVTASWITLANLYSGRLNEAVAAARRGLELDSLTAPMLNSASRAFLAAGQNRLAIATADRLPSLLPWPGIRAYVHAVAGDHETARRIVREIEGRRPLPWSAEQTIAYAWLGIGDTARALDALERATTLREIWPNWTPLIDPLYDGVRRSPRFAELVRRVGLDVQMMTAPVSRTR